VLERNKSKWRTDEEIEEIKKFLGGIVVKEVWTDNYYILHMGFCHTYP